MITCRLFLIFFLALTVSCAKGEKSIEGISNQANLVLGQSNFESATNNAGAGVTASSNSSLSGPKGIFFSNHKLYMADTSNNRVLVWTSNPSVINQPFNLVLGQLNATHNTPNQGEAASCSTLSGPTAVFVKGNRLFIADSGNHRVLIYKDVSTFLPGAAADFVIGHRNCSETRQNQLDAQTSGVRPDTLNNPTSVFYDGARIYIADTHNHRVLIYDGFPTGHGAAAKFVVGQLDLYSNTLKEVAANTLKNPGGIYMTDRNFLISDTGNNRVLIFNTIPSENGLSATTVIGQDTLTSSEAGTKSTRLSGPTHIHGIGKEILAIADSGNHRVLIYTDLSEKNGKFAANVIGQADFVSASPNRGATPNSNTLNAPHGVFLGDTFLWVTDTLNHRALRF